MSDRTEWVYSQTLCGFESCPGHKVFFDIVILRFWVVYRCSPLAVLVLPMSVRTGSLYGGVEKWLPREIHDLKTQVRLLAPLRKNLLIKYLPIMENQSPAPGQGKTPGQYSSDAICALIGLAGSALFVLGIVVYNLLT